MSSKPEAAVWLNGNPLPNVYDRNGIFDVDLRVDNRECADQPANVPGDWGAGVLVQESGTVPGNGTGIATLAQHSAQWGPSSIYIASDNKGIAPGDIPAFVNFAKSVGASPTSAQLARLEQGASFSLIGIPQSAAGTAWLNVAALPDNSTHTGGDVTGYIQYNHRAKAFNFVPGKAATFETQASDSGGKTNVITVGNVSYKESLTGTDASGFQILTLDPRTLALLNDTAVNTTTPAGTTELAAALGATTRPIGDVANNPTPLVIVQSIGLPKARSPQWATAADAIGALGGSRITFLNLGGKSTYSLVGSATDPTSAAEAGTYLGDAHPLEGTLSPGTDLGYQVVSSGPVGTVNLQLAAIEYQEPAKPTAWPAIDTAAETWIAGQVHLCPTGSTPGDQACNFRLQYAYDKAGLTWQDIFSRLGNKDVVYYPGDGHGFTAEQFEATRKELVHEVDLRNDVAGYFGTVETALAASSSDRHVNVQDIGQTVYNAVKPPPTAPSPGDSLLNALNIFTSVAPVILLFDPPGKAAYGTFATLFGFSKFVLSTLPGKPPSTFADSVKARADQLATEVQDEIDAANDEIYTQEGIILTDYGKLQAAAKGVDTGTQPGSPWKKPDRPSEYVSAIAQGVRVWFAEALVSYAYPWLLESTGPATSKANELVCHFGRSPLDHSVVSAAPWGDQPTSGQFSAVVGFGSAGEPLRSPIWFSRENPAKNGGASPPQSLTDYLFGTDTKAKQLGLNIHEFLRPAHLGPAHIAGPLTENCKLY